MASLFTNTQKLFFKIDIIWQKLIQHYKAIISKKKLLQKIDIKLEIWVVDTAGEGEGGTNWVSSIEIYSLTYAK